MRGAPVWFAVVVIVVALVAVARPRLEVALERRVSRAIVARIPVVSLPPAPVRRWAPVPLLDLELDGAPALFCGPPDGIVPVTDSEEV